MTTTFPTGLAAVLAAIDDACAKAGRDRDSVTLVAASKTVSAAAIEDVIAAGQRVFGENRVQEAKAKWPDLLATHPGVELHVIGPVQSNKARDAVALADTIHSVDRASLCVALAREIERQQRAPRLLVQVNTGEEPQKSGVLPADVDAFIANCRADFGLDIVGVTAIPPAGAPPEPHFALLAAIAERNGLPQLSMGMSSDFAVAIEYGATHVRVGSAVFGART
ncbi:YggS family pyridoxal phosphate-dependent enzyme [Actinokineospora sp. HUAS TT18]|uniref:YggS family pyridoxal phosphate-dependent enzyme n=1 Tax=Actinokineospora sp. HUAS TT18 TaxID=3447451 RepID=UPI003F51E460